MKLNRKLIVEERIFFLHLRLEGGERKKSDAYIKNIRMPFGVGLKFRRWPICPSRT